ncbi:MAG: glycine cleavage system protein T [Alphaproteobacteria bacterium]|nr:MAG: glycine cleavage system protein T [Alphaproteobacteria bacterium]
MTGPFRLDRALIRVSGPEARAFLNNLLTQSLDRLDEAGVLYAALLTPQGKVLADMFVWADGEGVLLELDPARREDVLRRLAMYKLRAQVTLEDVTDALAALYAPEPFDGAVADSRFPDGALGWRAIAARANHADGAAIYEAQRIAVGAPDLARDAGPDEVFALEALLEELNGVDFQKGCFIGQENVSRMKRRATTRKKFCPVVFEGDALAYGAEVTAGPAVLGEIRTGAAGRAIALLRLDRALAATEPLMGAGRPVRLAAPDWLALPAPSV